MRDVMSILRRRLYAQRMGRVFGPGLGSALGLGIAFFVATAVADTAHADSVADLSRPSSTIPGCVNTWNPTDPKYGSRTCEGQAVARSWEEQNASINIARNVIIEASRDPRRADKETVLSALDSLAAAAESMTSTFHPKLPTQNPFATTLTWMRQQFEAFHLPVPASLGAGFRTMAKTLDDPRLLITDRNAVYDRSAAMANALSEAVSETIDAVAPETDTAVLRAHQAAVQAAQDADRGFYNAASAAAAITKAAGPDHAAIADGQFRLLQASVARRPYRCVFSRLAAWHRPSPGRTISAGRAYPHLRAHRRRQRHRCRHPEPPGLSGLGLRARLQGRELCRHRPRPP